MSELDTALDLLKQEKDEVTEQLNNSKRQVEELKRNNEKLNEDNHRLKDEVSNLKNQVRIYSSNHLTFHLFSPHIFTLYFYKQKKYRRSFDYVFRN